MRWRTVGLCVLSLVGMTGCPEEFGKGGRIDQAVQQDVEESIRKPCTPEEYRRFCGGKKQGSPECREACGG
jgi:hypothetical protein